MPEYAMTIAEERKLGLGEDDQIIAEEQEAEVARMAQELICDPVKLRELDDYSEWTGDIFPVMAMLFEYSRNAKAIEPKSFARVVGTVDALRDHVMRAARKYVRDEAEANVNERWNAKPEDV